MGQVKRRNYFIKKAFQVKFISIFLILIVGGGLLIGGIIYRIANQALSESFYQSHLQVKSTWEIIFPAVAIATLLSIFITGAITIVAALLISHRVAGPLHRFERDIEEITKGNLTNQTKLRSNDELEALADKLNSMTKELNLRMKNIKTEIEKLQGSSQAAGQKESFDNLNKLISGFKL